MKQKKKIYKKASFWLTLVALIIMVPILLINIYIIVKANTNPDEIPGVFGYKPMIVMSGSMETSIYTGDLIFTKVVDPETLKEGDIIAFREEDNYVTTHRIISIKEVNGEKYFETKGDNNNTADQNLVSFEAVEGIYISRIAGLGNVLMFLQQPLGLAVVLLVILVVGIIVFAITGSSSNKKTDYDEKLIQELEQLIKEKAQREIESEDKKD